MYVLVKFKGNPVPQVFTVSHVSHASRLATMDDAEWASPPIGYNGNVSENETELGGGTHRGMFGQTIKAYRKEPADG